MIGRRPLVALGALGAIAGLVPHGTPAQPAAAGAMGDEVAALLARGGCALLVRHAITDPGVGDPPGFRLGDCSTQRNLSAEGRAQAGRLGAWLAYRGLKPAAVRSSRWCRCVDTARLAFGRVEPWEALDSFFGDRSDEPARSRMLREALAGRIARGAFEAWVSHQVNISALTGEGLAMGEALVVRAEGDRVRVAARLAPP